jgi:hypothetical protein
VIVYHDQVGRTEESAHAAGADQGAHRRRLAPSDRQAGQAEQTGKVGGVGDHLGGRLLEMVELRDQDRVHHRHVRGPDVGMHDGADAAAAVHPLARRARRPVDAAEAYLAGAGIDQPDAEVDQRRGVGLVVDLHEGHFTARQLEIEAGRRGRELALGGGHALQRQHRSEGARHFKPPGRTGC